MSVLRNPRKHLCYSISPFFWFKPQVPLSNTPREQLGWRQGSGSGRSGAQVLFPEPRELTSRESQTSPRMMPYFKSDWGYFCARAQNTPASCRLDVATSDVDSST